MPTPEAIAIAANAGGNVSPATPFLLAAAAGGNLAPATPGLTQPAGALNLGPGTPSSAAPASMVGVKNTLLMRVLIAEGFTLAMIQNDLGSALTCVMPTTRPNNSTLAVTWNSGTRTITVNRATDGSGSFTSTTAAVAAAIAAAVPGTVVSVSVGETENLVTYLTGGTMTFTSVLFCPAPIPSAPNAGGNLAPAAPGGIA
jgi:hypothetical protein